MGVETEELQALLRFTAAVVVSHPPDQVAVCPGLTETVAETLCHDVVEWQHVHAPHRGIDEYPLQATAFDRDGSVTLVFDEVPEHLIAEQQKTLLPVHGLAEPEQARRGVQAAKERAEGGGDARVAWRGEAGAEVCDSGLQRHGSLQPSSHGKRTAASERMRVPSDAAESGGSVFDRATA
jgi:hypothetical protein